MRAELFQSSTINGNVKKSSVNRYSFGSMAALAEASMIPTLDFSLFSTDIKDEDIEMDLLTFVSDHLTFAFETTGFLFLKNSGVSLDDINAINTVTSKFFHQPVEEKKKFARALYGENHGWVALEQERLDPTEPNDLKEAFNVTSLSCGSLQKWPNEEFRKITSDLFQKLIKISQRVLMIIALGLGLDPHFFRECHAIGSTENGTTLRSLFYPAITSGQMKLLKDGQLRCGEHSDYGSITLLISDKFDGLQVKEKDGSYIDVKSNDPTAVLVNLGDLMQRWTNDKLLATRHRVAFPKNEEQLCGQGGNNDEIIVPERRSLAFFVQPNNDVIVKPFEASSEYKPVRTMDYLNDRFKATYI